MLSCPQLFRKRAVAAFLCTATLFGVRPLAAQVNLGLSPMRVEFAAAPGKAFSGALTVSNAGAAKTRVRTELLDLYIDDTTTPQFVPNAPAEADFSCRSWLSVNPMEMEVDGRTQVPVRFTVRVPPGASERSFHCAIGFRTLPTETADSGMQMRAAVRMIAAIYPVVGKPSVTGVIKELRLEQIPGGSETLWRTVIVMENSGLMLYRPTGSLDVVNADGKVVESQKLESLPVLPKREQRFLAPLKSALTPGKYTLRARIDVGSEIQEASAAVIADPQPADQSTDGHLIKELKLEPVSSGSEVLWQAVAILNNHGPASCSPTGDLELVDAEGKVMESEKLDSAPLLPATEQRFVVPLKAALQPGTYTLRARIDGGGGIEEASMAVTVDAPRMPPK